MNGKQLLVALMALLERENAVSIPQAARLLGAGEQEVWEALEALVFCYDAVQVRLDLHGAHATLEREGTDRLLRLNEEETGILLDALVAQGFSPQDELCAKLLEAKGFLASGSADDGGTAAADAAAERPGAPAPSVRGVESGTPADLLERIAAACDDPAHHLLQLLYQREGAAAPTRRTVEPRALFSREGYRYLQAYCRDDAGWRTFRIDRVKDARTSGGTFVPRDDAPDVGLASGKRMPRARLRFASEDVLPAWPGLVRSARADDGTCEASLPWYGGLWLPKQIVGMMGAAVPLSPPELVEATRAYARSLLDAS